MKIEELKIFAIPEEMIVITKILAIQLDEKITNGPIVLYELNLVLCGKCSFKM